MTTAIVILAAGKGTRMKSNLPKVLHPLAGRPMIAYSLDLARALSDLPPVVIVGYKAEEVKAAVGNRATFVEQTEQLGTGHAVMQAEAALAGRADTVMVYAADMPLITPATLQRLRQAHAESGAAITMLSVIAEDPRGFGRVVRGEDGGALAIVEEIEATEEEKAIRELNAGVYCFDGAWLWPALHRLQPSPRKGEYYLTDLVGLAVADGRRAEVVTTETPAEALGVNTRVHLAEAETVVRRRKNRDLMLSGVTILDPDAVYIQPQVQVGRDTTIWPGVVLRGDTVIGEGCVIGPHAVLTDVHAGDGAVIGAGVLARGCHFPDGIDIPPGSILND
ncbi:MAG TPA: bifunctional N-acetylglucosamine-1-phosphate uridyltransferase/glucosamine-1-phosphate acetyltransferase [Anaerolineae bacterium]|nr:bifunctional N-acetylglucosamine-1-phosphate uridyltransferase/glucosamine-1-phosphate acetyltransferase [Anaerolineae bacterium]